MNRRDFIKSSATVAAVTPVAVATPALAKAPKKLFTTTPKTVDDLYTAINMLFKNQGEYDRAFIIERLRRIQFKNYTPLGNKREGFPQEIDGYFKTPQEPVIAVWKNILDIKSDVRNNWTLEEMEDWGSQGVTVGELVWWRTRPELIETKNGLYTVHMRAEFA